MKLLLSGLLAFSTLAASAQKWEAGFNVGISDDAHSNKFVYKNGQNKNVLSPTIAIKGAYNTKHWQLGVGIDYIRLDGGTVGQYVDYLFYTGWMNSYATNGLDYNKRIMAADPALPIYVFVNRKLTQTRLWPYAGVSLGYITCFRPQSPIPDTYKASTYHGIMFGLQAGANYKISRHFGLNVDGRATDMRFKNDTNPYHRYSISVTAGARYTF